MAASTVLRLPHPKAYQQQRRILLLTKPRHLLQLRLDEVRAAIVLNFEGLEYMNSSGIGLLVTLLIRVNREKQRLLTYGLSEHYRSIFQITRLDDAIGIHDSEEEAVEAADTA